MYLESYSTPGEHYRVNAFVTIYNKVKNNSNFLKRIAGNETKAFEINPFFKNEQLKIA